MMDNFWLWVRCFCVGDFESGKIWYMSGKRVVSCSFLVVD